MSRQIIQIGSGRPSKKGCKKFDIDRCAERERTCGYPNTLVLFHRAYQEYVGDDKNKRFYKMSMYNAVYKIFRSKHRITRLLETELIPFTNKII